MYLKSNDFTEGAVIPVEFAFCGPDPDRHARFGGNRNPELRWGDVPVGARSLALICHDPDAPSVGDDVNQEGRTVPADLPRANFFHWVLVDIPPSLNALEAGAYSGGVTAGGKSAGPPDSMRHGVNDYTRWFAGDAEMAGEYFGYDGPCPPWNDSIPHRYRFTLYALDLEECPVERRFSGPQVLDAIEGHVLASAGLSGLYSLNPNLPATVTIS
ncbi:MAG: YbhB/YbcL family Raf kinase inhibitor-like protein [Pseudomonadota bacterium]|nr:YbhB/YbcL family Raf kinase inhibitor-like protein [Pseudomonadota bacterium]